MDYVKRHVSECLEALAEAKLSLVLAVAANWDYEIEGMLLDAESRVDEAQAEARDALARAEKIIHSAS
jgi:hypothetical protein